MTTAARSGARPRSLQDDLLDDLRRGPAGGSAAPGTAASVHPRETAPRAAALAATPTLAVELRVTPRTWSSVRWTRRSDGDGLTVNLGPVCLSLGRLHP